MACKCYHHTKRAFSRLFSRYGELVGRHPVPFILLPVVLLTASGLGLLTLQQETDLETIYFPLNSRALNDRRTVRDTFNNTDNNYYNEFSRADQAQAVTVLFLSTTDSDVFSSECMAEISDVMRDIKQLSVTVDGRKVTFSDVCAKYESRCVVDGEYVLNTSFQAALAARAITYPRWTMNGTPVDLSTTVSGVITESGGVLASATVLRLSFKLTQDSRLWQERFLDFAAGLSTTWTEVAYESPDSLSEELDKGTQGDIILFSLTITLCCVYSSIVTTGGNPVSTRGLLALGGILATGLGIVGSMGLLSVCGVSFINIVGVIPFLLIGIGVDDMFLLLSSWSETVADKEMSVPCRLGSTLARAGVAITITSLTDLTAFFIGTASVFRSVTVFSLYAGVAVLFCYLANLTFFAGCLALHGRRVYSSRHWLTCRVTRPRQQLLSEGQSPCTAVCCGGAPPDHDRADESFCERWPRLLLPAIFSKTPVCLVIILVFVGYLVAAGYGVLNLPQGLVLQDLVPQTSYLHRYLAVVDQHFPTRIPIGFIVHSKVDYSGSDGQQLLGLLAVARDDPKIQSEFERCWLTSYLNSTFYDSSLPGQFVQNLNSFLSATPDLQQDVVMSEDRREVLASRCFVLSEGTREQYALARLMERVRELADGWPLPVLAYHSSFVAFEQFLAVLPATVLLAGCAVGVMAVVTFLFLPHPFMVALVVLTILMILTGIFGLFFYWGLTLSSITMIHLVMSVGFSVDFSAHVCAAYLLSGADTRQERAQDAMRHAVGPILNGATSTLLGVLLLAASTSFIFTSFFKVMVVVMVLGVAHAVLFLPAVLSLVGPLSAPQQSPDTVSPQRSVELDRRAANATASTGHITI